MQNLTINIDSILNQNVSKRLFEGGFGLEKENVRVTPNGELAQTPHPAVLGNKLTHPYITTDFSESQIEMITPVRSSIPEVLGFLETLHDEVSLHLDNEFLWPQSAPPILPEVDEDIPIAHFDGEGDDLEAYRTYLAKNYGRRKQLLSGIHFNVSFNEELLRYMYDSTVDISFSFDAFREQVYLKTLRNFKRNRWFLIALLSNSPVVHKTYERDCVKHLQALNEDSYRLPHSVSMRNSMCGYRNKQNLLLNYNSVSEYKKSLDSQIAEGTVRYSKEHYASIRMKTADPNKDITHLEVRLLDLNPFVKLGVDENQLKIIHQFLVYCLLKEEDQNLDSAEQERAFTNHDSAASSFNKEVSIIDHNGNKQSIEYASELLLKDIMHLTQDILPKDYQESAQLLSTLVHQPSQRPAHQMISELEKSSFIDWNLSKAKQYLTQSQSKTYNFYGLQDMELSTQLLMRAAIFRGVEVEVMDKSENFIKLSSGKTTEYVMQATRTSLDNYSSVLLMENKVMTKKVLHSAGIVVPQGSEYDSTQKAFDDFVFFKGKAIVVKPKSTNFGLGITIIKENTDAGIFQRAINMAFEHDRTVLVESFISGKEYRFFIINDEVVGVLHRVPANVVGDGHSTISQLVAVKNTDVLRGKAYKTPLEKLATGEPESMFLASQGYDFDTVPALDETIYLRENSNISTGGDSIDFTDDIHPSYIQLAIDSAKALNVKVTGLDMMIDDVTVPASKDNYAIIEMNFNPALHIHCHPFKGENRQVNNKILDALGF